MREITLHSALGAAPRRILCQLLGESLLLGAMGGAAGFSVATLGTYWIVQLLPPNFPRLHEIAPDFRVLAFAILLGITTTLLAGLAPAIRFLRLPLTAFLNESMDRSSETASSRRLRHAFVVAQFALTFALLVAAMTMLRELWRAQAAPLGVNVENLITARISMPDSIDADPTEREAEFFTELVEKVSRAGGVESAAAVDPLPFTSRDMITDFEILGRPMPKADWPRTRPCLVSPGYFNTMQIPVLRGRVFDSRDTRNAAPVAVVNETFAHTFFPNQDCIGQKVRPGLSGRLGETPMREIIGVVRDVEFAGPLVEQGPELYLPSTQSAASDMTLVVRSVRATNDLSDDIDWAVHSLDRSVPVFDIKPMRHYAQELFAQPRLESRLLAMFAGLGLTLSGMGVFAVMAYSVAQRKREIGIRLAFGASRAKVIGLLINEGMRLTGWSLLLGIIPSIAIALFSQKLFSESAHVNFAVIGECALLLVLVALSASWLPAHRAALENPINALGERSHRSR